MWCCSAWSSGPGPALHVNFGPENEKERIMNSRNLFTGIIGICTMAIITAAAQPARADDAPAEQKPQVVGLVFYADWCGTCKVLEPRIDEVKKELADKPVYITRVDLTDDATRAQSQLFANWVGLGEIYQEHGGATGFMLLIDPEEKKVIQRIGAQHSEQQIRQAIDQALAAADAPAEQREPGSPPDRPRDRREPGS
jgi:thiol-disulfide isomerase/thioredoxin